MARQRQKAPTDSGLSGDRVKLAKQKMRGSSKGKIYDKKEKPYPTVNEPAVVHPWNNAILKIRDNAIIDVFANTDNGIRINPNAKTIDMFTQSVKHHTTFIRSFVKRDEIHKVGGFWIINCTTARINAKGSASVTAGRNISLKAGGSMTLQAGGSINYKAGGTHNFS